MRKPTVPAVAGSMRRNSAGSIAAAEVARERPAEHDQHDRGGDAHGRVDAEDLLAPDVRGERRREQRHDQQQLALRAAGALQRCAASIERARAAGALASKRGFWRGGASSDEPTLPSPIGFHPLTDEL